MRGVLPNHDYDVTTEDQKEKIDYQHSQQDTMISVVFFFSNETVETVFNMSLMLASLNLPFRNLKRSSLSLLVLV